MFNFKDRLRKESGRDYIKLTMYPEMTKSFSLTPSQSPDSPSFTRWDQGGFQRFQFCSLPFKFRSSSLEQTMIEQLRKDLELKNEKILSMEETIHSLKNKLID